MRHRKLGAGKGGAGKGGVGKYKRGSGNMGAGSHPAAWGGGQEMLQLPYFDHCCSIIISGLK